MSYIGLDEYCEYGIGGAPTIAFGNVQGGFINDLGNEIAHEEGIMGQDDIVWNGLKPVASVESVYKGETFIDQATRTVWNGLPPAVQVRGGIIHATATLSALGNGYINELEAGCGAIGEAVKARYDLVLLTCTPQVVTTAATPAATAPFVWHAGAVTINNLALECQSWQARLNNGLDWDFHQDIKTAGSQRLPAAIRPGSEVVQLRATVRGHMFIDLTRDVPTMPIGAAILVGNGYTTKTITLRQLYLRSMPTPFAGPAEVVEWELDLESRHNTRISAATAPITID